jgi:hypothetical protein
MFIINPPNPRPPADEMVLINRIIWKMSNRIGFSGVQPLELRGKVWWKSGIVPEL